MPGFPHADPLSGGALGGLLIGLAAALLLLGLGRIAGVSGLLARATGLASSGAPRGLALAFVLGLPLGAALVMLLSGPVVARFPASPVTLALAGLLVGFGTRMGSGCTSGHGVCGLSRLSCCSLVATAVFMAAGIATVTLMNRLGVTW